MNMLKKLYRKIIAKIYYNKYKNVELIEDINFVIKTLHDNKQEMFFTENSKKYISQPERIYYIEQRNMIDRSITILVNMRKCL
jgi:hypothetical protein